MLVALLAGGPGADDSENKWMQAEVHHANTSDI